MLASYAWRIVEDCDYVVHIVNSNILILEWTGSDTGENVGEFANKVLKFQNVSGSNREI